MATPRFWELWDHLKVRLDTAEMQAMTLSAGRIFKVTEPYDEQTWEERVDWGRVVLVPQTHALWPEVSDHPYETKQLAWLVRCECNAPTTNFDPALRLEAMQAEAHQRLVEYVPGPFTYLRVVMPIYRWAPPQSIPLFDPERRVWFNSSQWRTEIWSVTP